MFFFVLDAHDGFFGFANRVFPDDAKGGRPPLFFLSALRERGAREAAPGAGADAVPSSFGILAREMSRFPPTAHTLVQTAVALQSGATSASDLLTAATRRMGATRHLNAFIGGVLPRAVESAEASDARRRIRAGSRSDAAFASDDATRHRHACGSRDRASSSSRLGLLDGVPIAVKDNFFVPGAPTTAGSNALRAFVSPETNTGAFESTVTRRLADGGALLFAKTNMDEFGMGSANAHSAFGAAVNPWTRRRSPSTPDDPDDSREPEPEPDRDRVPGGSSGGSAVAVASGVAVAAVGSDTGGSVRLPASYCGVVGFKPTYGRVSRWGLVPYCSSLDCPGFLTRTIADATVLLDATQGRDALDPVTLPSDARVAALARAVEARVAEETEKRNVRREAADAPVAASSSTRRARVEDGDGRGFLRSKPGFPLAGWRVGIPREYFVAELSDETRRAWTETADACARAGAAVVPVSLPNTRAALPAYYVIASAEASSNLARYDGVRFGGDRGDFGTATDGSDDASFRASSASFRGAAFGAETARRVLVGTFVSGSARVARYAEKAQKTRRAVSDDFERVFEEVDIILAPTAPAAAPPLREASSRDDATAAAAVAAYAADAMTVPASLAGLPAASLPVGLGVETGLPVGMQVIAARGNDADVLGFAMRLEERVEALGDRGGGAGPESRADGRGAVGWGERHRAAGVLQATRREGGVT